MSRPDRPHEPALRGPSRRPRLGARGSRSPSRSTSSSSWTCAPAGAHDDLSPDDRLRAGLRVWSRPIVEDASVRPAPRGVRRGASPRTSWPPIRRSTRSSSACASRPSSWPGRSTTPRSRSPAGDSTTPPPGGSVTASRTGADGPTGRRVGSRGSAGGSIVWPSRRTSRVTVSSGAYWLSVASSGCSPSTATPLILTMMSPSWRPASAAGVPGWTAGLLPLPPPSHAPSWTGRLSLVGELAGDGHVADAHVRAGQLLARRRPGP